MNDLIAWIAAEADPEIVAKASVAKKSLGKAGAPGVRSSADGAKAAAPAQGLGAHTFALRATVGIEQPAPLTRDVKDGADSAFPESRGRDSASAKGEAEVRAGSAADDEGNGAPGSASSSSLPVPAALELAAEIADRDYESDRQRRVYRGRTVAMLRRYMRYSIETGRLPSLLGREFFRAKVTTYTVVTFEDRVIFVHDMEKCLGRLDEFSRQLIARHILQEHDRWATAKLLHCNEKTVRRYTPIVLDLLSEILVEVGLLERINRVRENSCQEGKSASIDASDCEDGKYKF